MADCDGKAWAGYRWVKCTNKAKFERNGRHYCGVHDPVTKAERDAKREALERTKRNARVAARQANTVTVQDYAPDGSTCTLMFKGTLRHYKEVVE